MKKNNESTSFVLLLFAVGIVIAALSVMDAPPPGKITNVGGAGGAVACYNIGRDQPISVKKGHTLDYRNNKWFLDDRVIGAALAEDEPVELCGDPDLMIHLEVNDAP